MRQFSRYGICLRGLDCHYDRCAHVMILLYAFTKKAIE